MASLPTAQCSAGPAKMHARPVRAGALARGKPLESSSNRRLHLLLSAGGLGSLLLGAWMATNSSLPQAIPDGLRCWLP